jgi:transcriptional regulator with XRE-family HTH domain
MTKVYSALSRSVQIPIEFARELRLRKGYTQSEIGARLNCSPATISAIENGKASARVLADYLVTLAIAPNARKRSPGGAQRAGRRKEH